MRTHKECNDHVETSSTVAARSGSNTGGGKCGRIDHDNVYNDYNDDDFNHDNDSRRKSPVNPLWQRNPSLKKNLPMKKRSLMT